MRQNIAARAFKIGHDGTALQTEITLSSIQTMALATDKDNLPTELESFASAGFTHVVLNGDDHAVMPSIDAGILMQQTQQHRHLTI